MIILRKPYNKPSVVINADLLGSRNGANQVFSLSTGYKSGLMFITYNGQALYPENDFTEVSDTEIEFIYLKPYTDDILKAHYEKI